MWHLQFPAVHKMTIQNLQDNVPVYPTLNNTAISVLIFADLESPVKTPETHDSQQKKQKVIAIIRLIFDTVKGKITPT